MVVTIINGSPRKNGATGKILKKIGGFLKSKGDVKVNYVDLSDFGMKFCKGCTACFRTGECIIKEDGLEALSLMIGKSDGLIIGTPTYESNVHGQLKTFMDRGHFVVEQLLTNKYCFAVSTYENATGSKALNILTKLFLLSGGINAGKLLVKVDFNKDPFMQKGVQERFDRGMNKYYSYLKNKKKKGIIGRLISWAIISFGFKKRVLGHRDRYAGVIRKWTELGILEN